MKVIVNDLEKELVYLDSNGINIANDIVLQFENLDREDDRYMMSEEQYEFWDEYFTNLENDEAKLKELAELLGIEVEEIKEAVMANIIDDPETHHQAYQKVFKDLLKYSDVHPIDCLCFEYGISRYKLAKNMGISYTTIQSIANRDTPINKINVDILNKIANVLNLTLDDTYKKLKSYEHPKYKVRWINGWGDEEDNIYTYQYYLEIDNKKKVKIPNEIMEEFIQENSNYVNGTGTNMFRGRNEKELTIKLVQMLKENGII